jgi:hypothetical protein
MYGVQNQKIGRAPLARKQPITVAVEKFALALKEVKEGKSIR